ncbi:16651_t:CDS:2 [Cetraspora pellucida]|uniref:16651_t:CDS:1 n=1 Tax=Cetraspora pellucida TaxID=1433469 RepID=A0ACA9K458_9GLOM|nr:16651_t:CDS:2 [Cetraspora pellucida]
MPSSPQEVKVYMNHCAACTVTTSIKEKTDIRNVVSTALWQHVQTDLIDFQDFAETTITTFETAFETTITASETASETTFETTTPETTAPGIITNEDAIEQRISYMLEMHQSISASLEKYRAKLGHNIVKVNGEDIRVSVKWVWAIKKP